MINRIRITNFQAHKSSELSLHPGINVVTGSSDSGKSSIIRALMWLFTNKPAGESFRTWKSDGNIIVSANIGGRTISKTRIDSKNTYKIDGVEYEATGTTPFKELLEATKINEYNYQTQHQPYFLLQDSSGKVAEKINEVIGLNVIDRLLSNLRSMLTDKKKLSASILTDIESQKRDLSNYDNLEQVEKIIVEIEDYDSDISVISTEYVAISSLLTRIRANQARMNELPDYTGADIIITKIRDLTREIDALDRRISTISRICESIDQLQSSLEEAEIKLDESTEKLEAEIKRMGICPLCGGKLNATKMLEKL